MGSEMCIRDRAKMSAGVRTLRIADGPDEVHLRSIARREINKHT